MKEQIEEAIDKVNKLHSLELSYTMQRILADSIIASIKDTKLSDFIEEFLPKY